MGITIPDFDVSFPEEMCGKATIHANPGRILIRLYCGHFRTCPKCAAYRVQSWKKRIMDYADTSWNVAYIPEDEHRSMVEKLKRRGLEYFAFPMKMNGAQAEDHVTSVFLFEPGDGIAGNPIPWGYELEKELKRWTQTPPGKRLSSSHGMVPPRKEPVEDREMTLIQAPLETVTKTIVEEGGEYWGDGDMQCYDGISWEQLKVALEAKGIKMRELSHREQENVTIPVHKPPREGPQTIKLPL